MAHEVMWTKVIVEEFINQAMLSEEEEHVIRTRACGWSISKQAMHLGMSESSINRIIARLKKKYDQVAEYDPLLPPRKRSSLEDWMDKN